jgi:uncharacterized protein YbaA (DUF1428 family)
MGYVDGFLVPVKKSRLDEYQALARLASQVWKDHGATAYVECVGDDVPHGQLTSFTRAVQLAEDEVVIFSWAVFPSREARDAANQKIMHDPRLKVCETDPPFEGKRLVFGGFLPFVGLEQ